MVLLAVTWFGAARVSAGEPEDLYLAVTLNGTAATEPLRFVRTARGLAAPAEVLQRLGVLAPAGSDGLVWLDTLPQAAVGFDAASQHLHLTVPVALLDRLPLRVSGALGEPAPRAPDAALPALVFNYDLFATAGAGSRAVSAWTEVRVSGIGPGAWLHSGLARLDEGGRARHRSVRLDTRWQLDFPRELGTLTVGDTWTGGLAWTRATRIGGVRLARDFGLHPYQGTAPLALFEGEAVLPSTVDLYLDGMRRSTQEVPPGRFQIEAAPTAAGAGVAQVVVTDIHGRSQILSFDLYGAPQLLREGLVDGSVEAGWIRRGHGLRSFDYDDRPVAALSVRRGWRDDLTLEAHAEAGAGVRMAGGGALWRLPAKGGLLHGSLAASRSAAGAGRQAAWGYSWNTRCVHFSLQSLRRSGAFRDLASTADGAPPRGSDTLFAGVDTAWGYWHASLVRQRPAEGADFRMVTVGWTRALPGPSTLSISASRQPGAAHSGALHLAWSMPLEQRTALAASARRTPRGMQLGVEASHSAAAQPGALGWRVHAASRSMQAQVSQSLPAGEWSAGIMRSSGEAPSLYGGARGALLWHGAGLQALARVDDAFALVSTDGVPGVPVRLENRPAGSTDATGHLLVPRLNAYQRNQLTIDTLDLPHDFRAERVAADVVPPRGGGSRVRFALRRVRTVELVLQGRDGTPLPAGTALAVHAAVGGERTAAGFVGHEGQVYLEDAPEGGEIRADLPGRPCSARLPALPGTGRIQLGAITCH